MRVETTDNTTCLNCNVAFDVGRDYCVELGCGVPLNRLTSKPKVKIKYKYTRKKQEAAWARMLTSKSRAHKRNLSFDMTIEFIRELIKQPCHYCSRTMPIEMDRKDNEVGYIITNVVPACRRCNMVKNHYLTYDEMITVAQALGWRS